MTRAQRPLRFHGPDGLELTGVLWEAAQPARPPELLFTGGNGFPVQAYAPALAGLPPDVTVHGLNHRGHGGSAVPEHAEDYGALVADLRAYVEQRMRPPVILAGHSLGAILALRLAAEAPALAAGLLLLEPPLRLRRGEQASPELAEDLRAFIERARNRRDAWPAREEAAAWFAESLLYRSWDAGARGGFVAAGLLATPDGGVRLATPPWLEAALYEAVHREDLFELAARAPCAGVLLRGTESTAVQPAALEEIADALPVGAVLPVPGTHTFPMEHPRETGQRMASALRLLRGETGLALTGAPAGRTG
jgi:pimeloyl-ACP methyl ester carboxylesterase